MRRGRMFNNFIRYIFFAAVAVLIGTPDSHAVQVTFDSYPSFMRTRARVFNNSTFNSSNLISGSGRKDRIFFVDTTLRLAPELRLSDNIRIVTQVDVADNVIWGGRTSQLLGGGGTLVNSGISPTDSFRGAFLTPVYSPVAFLDSSLGPALDRDAAVQPDSGWFNIRMAYMHIELPEEFGAIRIGRQPFDWGLGIFSNGGHDPSSDFGTLVDRLLFVKTFELPSSTPITGTVTTMVFADLRTGGTDELTSTGIGYSGIGAGIVYNKPSYQDGTTDFTLGSFVYPWIRQRNFDGGNYFGGGTGDLDRLTIYSFMLDIRRNSFRLAGEINGAQGRFSNVTGFNPCPAFICRRVVLNRDETKISNQIAWAARLEFTPRDIVEVVGGEFGWVDGDKIGDGGEYWEGNDSIDGGFIAFNPAYNIDHLLLKHVLPTIYQSANSSLFTQSEGGIQNTRYARFYVDFNLSESIVMKNQWLAAWTNETDGLFVAGESVKTFIGNELETTLSFRLMPGVSLDFTGSVVFASGGLEDMFEGQAWNNIVRGSSNSIDVQSGSAPTVRQVQFLNPDGTASVPGLTSTITIAAGEISNPVAPEVQQKAYDALREEFGNIYNSNKDRLWSLQTVLTIQLDTVLDERI